MGAGATYSRSQVPPEELLEELDELEDEPPEELEDELDEEPPDELLQADPVPALIPSSVPSDRIEGQPSYNFV